MKYKNYYKILGLSSAKVSDDEIKSAYRALAKKYHPDLNGGDDSLSEKFKDINEAYEVLGHVASRKKYDRVHFAYKFRDGFSTSHVKEKVNMTSGVSEFMNTFFGAPSGKKVVTNLDKYEKSARKEKGEDLSSEIEISLEEAFFGGERKIAYKTLENKIKTLLITLPKGIHPGEKIRLQGQGKEGKNGGENGDFYITVNMVPHDRFTLEGADLHLDLLITPWEAAFGAEVEIVRYRCEYFVPRAG